MRRFGYYLILILLCCAMWCILMGDFQLITVILGLVGGVVVVFITHRYILASADRAAHVLSPLRALHYLGYLIISIYRSGFALIPAILSGRCNIGAYRIRTAVTGSWSRALLANSITMTPGTVTVDQQDDTLTVLWFQADTRDTRQAARRIAGGFERILAGRRPEK